jgi:hypothetical protein
MSLDGPTVLKPGGELNASLAALGLSSTSISNERMTKPRHYISKCREQTAEATRHRVLDAAKALFARHGIDQVTIAQIGAKSGVAASTVYALYKSKDGIP